MTLGDLVKNRRNGQVGHVVAVDGPMAIVDTPHGVQRWVPANLITLRATRVPRSKPGAASSPSPRRVVISSPFTAASLPARVDGRPLRDLLAGPGRMRLGPTGPPTQVNLASQVNNILPRPSLPLALAGAGASNADVGGVSVDGTTIVVNPSTGEISATLLQAQPFSAGGTILTPTSTVVVVVWYAAYAATVTNVLGFAGGAAGSVVNATVNGLPLLVSNLTLAAHDEWIDGGAVQNTALVLGSVLEIELITLVGAPSQVAVQIQCTRP